MNLPIFKTRTYVLHAALVALYALPAAAAASTLPKLGLFHRTPSTTVKPQSVIVDFRNTSVQPRELQIGTERFPVTPRGSLFLRVSVGSNVRVYSSMNSHIDGQTLVTVTSALDGHEVAIK